jgi:hypothetical protein
MLLQQPLVLIRAAFLQHNMSQLESKSVNARGVDHPGPQHHTRVHTTWDILESNAFQNVQIFKLVYINLNFCVHDFYL